MEVRRNIWITAHPGDAVSPGGFVRVVWGAEPAGAIHRLPWWYMELAQHTN